MILQDTSINEDLPYKERPSLPRNKGQLDATIKALKPSQTKVCIIDPSSGIIKLWKFSNLTFRGYLVGIILVLFARSSLFLFHRLSRAHEDRVVYWQFLVSSVGAVCGKARKTITTILPLPKQRVVRYSLAWWQLITIKEMNHSLLPLKDK